MPNHEEEKMFEAANRLFDSLEFDPPKEGALEEL